MTQQILHSQEIFHCIKDELKKVSSQIVIVSAYIKIEALKEVDLHLKDNVEKIILVRFRKSDVIANSTDIELYDYCKQNKWKMYFDFNLHSKIYIFDKQTYLIGSANATLSGLGLKLISNIESAVFGECNASEYRKLLEVFHSSRLMNDSIITSFINQFEDSSSKIFEEWFLHELKLTKEVVLQNLWVLDFPDSHNPLIPSNHDLELLGLSHENQMDMNVVKKKFKNLKCYKWLLMNIESEIYFGELSAKLHNALVDNPTPYRKSVKEILAALLNWVIYLQLEDIAIDRPNYSQRIRKLIK